MTHLRSPLRLVRAAVFAAVCVVLAATGHATMSGGHIPLPSLLVAFGLTGAAAWLAGGRRRGPLSIGAGLLTVQGAVHLIFTEGGSPARPHHAVASHAGAAHHGEPGSMAMHGSGQGITAAQDAGHGDTGMLAVHLLAALCCALWLWRGEIAFFRLLRCLRALAFAPLRLVLSATGVSMAPVRQLTAPLRSTGADLCARLRSAFLFPVLSRRGPPGRPVLDDTAPARPQGQPA